MQRFYGTTGAFAGTFAFGGGLCGAIDSEFGPDGSLYVSSNCNSRVLRFDGSSGAFHDTFVRNKSGDLGAPGWLLFVP